MSEALEAIRELHIQARRGLEISQGTLRRADEAIHALAKLETDLLAANQRCQDLQVLVDCYALGNTITCNDPEHCTCSTQEQKVRCPRGVEHPDG